MLELDGTEEPFCLTVDCDCGVVYTATAAGITGFQPSNQEVSCICIPGMQIASETSTSSAMRFKPKEKKIHTIKVIHVGPLIGYYLCENN